MVFGDLIIGLMFIFIVIGFGLIGLGTILLIIIHGAGIVGIDLITTMGGIDLTHLGIIGTTVLGTTQDIMLFGILVDRITLLILMVEEEANLSRILL